jgi:hypothetical protein
MPADDEIMLDKLSPLLSILYKHIEGGIAKARSFFEAEEEPPDPWLFSHIVRWHVCKRLDNLKDPSLSYERSLQAMSGIDITYGDRYVKVFKASDGELPAAGRSHPRQEFYKGNLFGQDEWGLPTYLAVIWDVNNHSTVVIWSGHIGSHEDHALLLGKDLRKDLVNQGTLG